jgi:hypothetical protein
MTAIFFEYIPGPVIVEIFPTLQCNVHCAQCDRGEEDSVIVDFSECSQLIENLKHNSSFELKRFRISGREPLLHPKINELIQYLSECAPNLLVEVFSNGLRVDVLTPLSLEKIFLAISVYSYTEKQLAKNAALHAIVTNTRYKKALIDVDNHEIISPPGTERNDFNPFSFCFSPTLVCATKKVYPCCRAHLFEQMYAKKYHCELDTPDLYSKLIEIIQAGELCTHCPRIYKDTTIVPCSQKKDYTQPIT